MSRRCPPRSRCGCGPPAPCGSPASTRGSRTAVAGVSPNLPPRWWRPATTCHDGTKDSANPASWEQVDPADYAAPGEFEVTGVVEGSGQPAVARVVVGGGAPAFRSRGRRRRGSWTAGRAFHRPASGRSSSRMACSATPHHAGTRLGRVARASTRGLDGTGAGTGWRRRRSTSPPVTPGALGRRGMVGERHDPAAVGRSAWRRGRAGARPALTPARPPSSRGSPGAPAG